MLSTSEAVQFRWRRQTTALFAPPTPKTSPFSHRRKCFAIYCFVLIWLLCFMKTGHFDIIEMFTGFIPPIHNTHPQYHTSFFVRTVIDYSYSRHPIKCVRSVPRERIAVFARSLQSNFYQPARQNHIKAVLWHALPCIDPNYAPPLGMPCK